MDAEASGAIDRLYSEDKAALVFLGGKNSAKELQAFTAYAQSLEEPDMLFYASDLTGEQGKALKDVIGANSLPFIALVKPIDEENLRKYYFREAVTVENLAAFVALYKEKKLKRDYKSEAIPAERSEPVKQIVGANYLEQVIRADKYVLVEFYGDDCPHCQKVTPVDKGCEALQGTGREDGF